jgi:hypothetical protein
MSVCTITIHVACCFTFAFGLEFESFGSASDDQGLKHEVNGDLVHALRPYALDPRYAFMYL